ncbi:hypothetical protein Barb4_00063 [Bacteroidales bacterium Barb4]|nr:hypothetical protein Barb4_00063 [Bacteroidales bacterium Barb4]
MKNMNSKVLSLIENAVVSAVDRLVKDNFGKSVSDLNLQVNPENGEFQIYDDSENRLGKIVIFDWISKDENEDEFNEQVAATLKGIVTNLSAKGVFNKSCFVKPLSIYLTDDDFVIIEELLFLGDDEVVRVDDPLLKDLSADLGDFLKKLLSDMK